jgi:hypothetical protein
MKSSDRAVVDELLVIGDWLVADLSDPAIRIIDSCKLVAFAATPD